MPFLCEMCKMQFNLSLKSFLCSSFWTWEILCFKTSIDVFQYFSSSILSLGINISLSSFFSSIAFSILAFNGSFSFSFLNPLHIWLTPSRLNFFLYNNRIYMEVKPILLLFYLKFR